MQWLSYLPEPVTALIPLATVIQYAHEQDLDTSEEEVSEEEEGYTTEEEDATSEEEEEDSEEESDDEHMHSEASHDFSPPTTRRVHPAPVVARFGTYPLDHPATNAPVRVNNRYVDPRRPVIVRFDDPSSEEDEDEEESEEEEEEEASARSRTSRNNRASLQDLRAAWALEEEDDDDDEEDVSDDGSSVAMPDSSEEEMSEDEREQREAEDQQRVTSASTALLGACTICHEDDVVEPTMCKNCKNIVGCYTCVARWMRASDHPQCPLCRERWTENPDRAIAVRLLY